MRWILRIFYILFLIAFVLIAIAFLSANAVPHQLGFLEWKTFEMTVGVFVLLAFIIGAVIGLLSGIPMIVGMRMQIRKMQKRLSEQQLPSADA